MKNILNACKKSGSVLLISIVVLMYISALGAAFFKIFCDADRKEDITYKNYDMYSKGNLNEVMCDVNDYFNSYRETLCSLKEKNFFIKGKINFYYDSSIDKFCIRYIYRGLTYEEVLRYVKKDDKILFIPKEKKYIS